MTEPSLPPIRFILLGGFLGAGKTTLIARLARHYRQRGLVVAVITNDKAADSVDALNLRGQGLHVGELPGVCFCGNVDELIAMVDALGTATRPDVVLAEPVGSCLDMTATVIRPLEQAFAARFSVAPYGVLVKPTHAAKILRNEPNAGVSPKAAYLFRQQLAEADFIVINRCDTLSDGEIAELTQLLGEHYPHARVAAVSAKTGTGCETVFDWLEQSGEAQRRAAPIDYAAYAAGEAELAWLNGAFVAEFPEPVDVDAFLLDALERVRAGLQSEAAEAVHVKLIALWSGRHAAANLISNTVDAESSYRSNAEAAYFHGVVNARVIASPTTLRRQIEAGLPAAALRRQGKLEFADLHCFRPGSPVQSSRSIAEM